MFSSERNAFGAHRSTGAAALSDTHLSEFDLPVCSVHHLAHGLSRARARSPQDCVCTGLTCCAQLESGVGGWEISIYVCSLLRCFRLCWISRS